MSQNAKRSSRIWFWGMAIIADDLIRNVMNCGSNVEESLNVEYVPIYSIAGYPECMEECFSNRSREN